MSASDAAPERTIETLFLEERPYPPPAGFSAQANAQPEVYERDLEEFWAEHDRVAYCWEGEPEDDRVITYAGLQRDVGASRTP